MKNLSESERKRAMQTISAAKKLFAYSAKEVFERNDGNDGCRISEIVGNAVCALMTIAETCRERAKRKGKK